MLKVWIFGFILMFFVSCNNPSTPVKSVDSTPFFDVKGFFQTEIRQLTEGGVRIQKTITVGDKSETKVIEKADFTQELSLFTASDINKPALHDKYRVEKTSGKSLESFIAIDDDVKTKRVDVFRFPPNGVQQVMIFNNDKSVLSESGQSLKYLVGKGFTIETLQKFTGADSSKLKIDVVFLK